MTLLEQAPVAPPTAAPPRSSTLRRLARRPSAVVALVFLVLLSVAAVFAPWVAPYPPDQQDLDALYAGPSATHWLGQDYLGRDVLSRIIHGARVSLASSVIAVGLAVGVAVPIGLASGYLGGRVDMVLMRIVDGVQAIPSLVLAIAVAGLLGPSLRNIVLALALVFVPTFVRLVRGQTLAVREEVFVEASRSVGASGTWIVRKRILHNVASPLIVQISVTLGFGLLAEAGLSFLGLGLQPPAATWGGMLSSAYVDILTDGTAVLAPGLAILLTVWAFNLLGDGLRDALGARS